MTARSHARGLLALLLAAGVASACLAAGGRVDPGKGAAGIELGWTFAHVEEILGKPDRSEPSPNAPDFELHHYDSRGLSIFVGDRGLVLGISVTSPAYKTPQGLGVGSTEKQVKAAYGRGLQRGEGNLTYATRGLAFSFRDGKATRLYVFKPEDERPLLGDRLIVPGLRAGELRLGAPAAAVQKAWGKPEATTDVAGARAWLYPDRGVSVLVRSGKIEGLLIETGDFITREGIKVGSSRQEVVAALGKGFQASGKQLFYDAQGIGFVLEQGRVIEIQLLRPR